MVSFPAAAVHGNKKAAIGGGIILTGFILFSAINNFTKSEGGRKTSAGIQSRINKLHSFIEGPQIKRDFCHFFCYY